MKYSCDRRRPGRVVIHGGGRRLGRRLRQAVKGGKGGSLESWKQRVRGGQAVKRGTGESLESRKQNGDTLTGSPPGSSEVPRFGRKVTV